MIENLHQHYFKLKRRCSAKKTTHPKRYGYKKAMKRLLAQIRNRIDDLHRKLAHWLCKNHRVVLLPEFRVSHMLYNQDKKRQLSSSTARAMSSLGHYRFRQFLIHKAREFPSCSVIICDEVFTSKVCYKSSLKRT